MDIQKSNQNRRGSQQTQIKGRLKTIKIQEGKRFPDTNEEAQILCLLYKDDHHSPDCIELKNIEERKNFLVKNKLCHNSTGGCHTASKCKSSMAC